MEWPISLIDGPIGMKGMVLLLYKNAITGEVCAFVVVDLVLDRDDESEVDLVWSRLHPRTNLLQFQLNG